ncbi:MAG TPA: sugar transferase [Gemmatimonadaceae bacterium]
MESNLSLSYQTLKRGIDFSIALILFLVLSPVMLIVALLVRAKLGSPVFFRQQRPGLHGKPFTLVKFRTMLQTGTHDQRPLSDHERITTFGQFLRSMSLDELPELTNVLRGEMSLVGPRPLLMEYLPLYSAEQRGRHDVRPGITGLAQVSGRNALDWQQRFALDVWYVEHLSLGLDLRILLATIKRVLSREGITERGQATMTKFGGNSGT